MDLNLNGGVLTAADITVNALSLVRVVGVMQMYSGTTGNGAGYYDDFDGKWVYLTLDAFRTIGNASSGAAIAQAWTATLFAHVWTQYSNTQAPLLTSAGAGASRGASAAADYAANNRITLPDYRGRVIAGAGTGASLTARTLHAQTGEESHVLTIAELPSHNHNVLQTSRTTAVTGNAGALEQGDITQTVVPISTIITNTGSGTAHNVIQPSAFEHFLISAGSR